MAIATGLWWDYSKPAVLAWTLTLRIEHGNILLSSLALLVTLAGASFWSIVAFLLHAWKVRGDTASAVNLQHQVSLRNSHSSFGMIREMFKIHRAWSSRRPPGLLAQTCSIALPAFLIFTGFVVATIFSSSVASKAYGTIIARVSEDTCGIWTFNKTDIRGFAAESAKLSNDTIQARTYVGNFYAGSTPGAATARSVFVKTTLPYTTSQTAPCPIPASNRCLLGADSAYRVTTDMLDSQQMFGINAPEQDRVTLQLNVTCSPLHTSDLVESREINDRLFWVWHLGKVGNTEDTYFYNTETPLTNTAYRLETRPALAPGTHGGNGSVGPWKPIADFDRSDADVSLFFLSQNSLGYFAPVFDPWFSANGSNPVTGDSTTFYHADFGVSIIGCADQYKMCNPTTGACTKPGGYSWLFDSVLTDNTLGFNPAQQAVAGRFIFGLAMAGTYSTAQVLGAGALWANNLVWTGNLSPGLPNNQWQIEVLGWFQTSLARIQAYVVEFASNTGHLGPFGRVVSPYEKQDEVSMAQQSQCRNQLVQTAGEVQNFFFAGVLLIVCFSAAIILLDLALEPLVDLFCTTMSWHSPTIRARQADDNLHLLRMGLAKGDGGGWELGKGDIPVRADDGKFMRPTLQGISPLVSYS